MLYIFFHPFLAIPADYGFNLTYVFEIAPKTPMTSEHLAGVVVNLPVPPVDLFSEVRD